MLVGLGGYGILRQLDLGTGPLGQWLLAEEARTTSDQTRSGGALGIGAVTQPRAELAVPGADAGEGFPALGMEPESVDAVPSGAPDAGETPGPEGTGGTRLMELSRLRGLR